jgi:two-component system LytT family sensor kinase
MKAYGDGTLAASDIPPSVSRPEPREGWPSVKRWLLFGLVWQAIGFLGTLLVSLPVGSFHAFIHWVIMGATFTNGSALLGGAFLMLYGRYWRRPLRHPAWRAVVVFLGLAAAAAAAAATSIDIGPRFCAMDGFRPERWHLLIVSLNVMLMIAIALLCALAVLHERLSGELARKIRESERLERLNVESQLAALQSKVNPHFLFNTLNAMADLVRSKPASVERMILNLSDIYRRVLDLPETSGVSLAEELTLVEQYLEIEKIRMGARLTYTIDVPEELRSVVLPPLALEILVENAVRHGLARRKQGGSLRIGARRHDGAARIEVEDDGPGFGGQGGGAGFGLLSVRQRLALLYGERASLEVGPAVQGGTRAVLEIPVQCPS